MQRNRLHFAKRIMWPLLSLVAVILLARFLLQDHKPLVPNPAPQASMVRVIYVTEYVKCGDTTIMVKDVKQDGVDSLVASLSPGWTTQKEQDGEIRFSKKVNDWCPDHNHYRLIKMHKGRVVVFRGQIPVERFILYDHEELRESLIIHKETLKQLKQGVLLFSEDPEHLDVLVKSYLEGITD